MQHPPLREIHLKHPPSQNNPSDYGWPQYAIQVNGGTQQDPSSVERTFCPLPYAAQKASAATKRYRTKSNPPSAATKHKSPRPFPLIFSLGVPLPSWSREKIRCFAHIPILGIVCLPILRAQMSITVLCGEHRFLLLIFMDL